QEPRRPRTVSPAVDRDLETICLKCLNKDPARRYRSAAALAEDLERFLAGEPIQARPVSRVERLRRWARRNPGLAAAGALAGLAVVGVVVVAVLWAVNESAHAERLESAHRELSREQRETKKALEKARAERAKADTRFQLAHQAVGDFCIRLGEE